MWFSTIAHLSLTRVGIRVTSQFMIHDSSSSRSSLLKDLTMMVDYSGTTGDSFDLKRFINFGELVLGDEPTELTLRKVESLENHVKDIQVLVAFGRSVAASASCSAHSSLFAMQSAVAEASISFFCFGF